jgi:hypothetical protein
MVLSEAAWDSKYVAKDSGYMDVNVKAIGGDTQSATDLKDFADAGYDPATNKVQGVVLVDTTTDVTNEVSADVTKISGDSVAADNLELDYDGTGYNKANSTIGTCTANTDMRGTDSAALASVCTEARLAELDAANLPATTDNIETDTQDIQTQIGTAGAGLTALVDAILDEEVDNDGTAISLRGAQKLTLSVLTGKSSGGGTATVKFRDIADTKDRISATVDANGNRTAVGTRDAT